MTDPEDVHVEPEEPKEPRPGEPTPSPKARQSLSKVRRELTDEEFSSPVVQRMLMDEIDRLQRDNTELAEYRDLYHKADKRASVLEVQSRRALALEILFDACLVVGAAAVGYAPAVWASQPTGWIALVFGAVLIIGGLVSRVVKR